MILTKMMRKFRIGRGELYIAIIGMVVLLWLHGDLLFFWDAILPFHPASDIYFYSFTWNQAIFNGIPNAANEWLGYFLVMYFLHDIFHLTLPLSQLTLFYSLFTFSGLTMYRLIKYLNVENYDANFSLPAFAGALIYMFNFYVDLFLLSDFFESWFLYSLLPLIILVILSGIRKSVKKEPYWIDILYLLILFQIVSVSFWEEPYLIWAIFIIFIFVFNYILQNRNSYNHVNYLAILKFSLLSFSMVIITGLWYIYIYIQTLIESLKSISPSGISGDLVAYHILINSLTTLGSEPFKRALYIIAIYPTYSPPPGGLFIWQSVYKIILSPLNLIFFISAIIFLFVIFFPLTQKNSSKNEIFRNKLLYGSIFILVFFGLQGINPILRWSINVLLTLKFPYISLLYGTNMQFLIFPLIFFYAIAGSKTFLAMDELKGQKITNARLPKKRRLKSRIIFKKNIIRKHLKLITFVLLITVVAIYPWYMWTPYATPVYNTGYEGRIIPSVVNIPNYVYEMTDYIQSNANNSNTLILPTSNNFLTMSFNKSSFADDQYPALMFGSPVLFQQDIAFNNVTSDIENIIYNPLLIGNNLSNYLSALNVKFVVLNKDFIIGAGNYFYENISYLQNLLQYQPNIQLVKTFGPLQVYENMGNTGIIQIGNAVHFILNASHPYGCSSIIRNLSAKGFQKSNLPPVNYNITNNGSITLENNKLISKLNPVNFINNNPLNINLTKYHYLSVTFKTSDSNVSLYVAGSSGFYNGSFGETILQPLNLTSNVLSPLLYVNSTNFKTFVYPLYGQPPMWYSHFNRTHNYTLNSLTFSLSFNHLIANESGSIEISNLTVSEFISQNQNFDFMANGINTKDQVLVPNDIYTNNTSFSKMSLSSKEINPTKYVVKIKNANSPFILDFKQNFNSGWKIYINGKESDISHFTADIYNNGWLLTQKGNYTIEIIYEPQHEYDVVIWISFYSFVLIAAVIISYQSYMYYTRGFKKTSKLRGDPLP